METRAAAKYHQFKLFNEAGYYISEENRYLDFQYLSVDYTATLSVGLYDNMTDLISAVVLAMDAAAVGVAGLFTHDYVHTPSVPSVITITGSGTWTIRWHNGANAASTSRLAGMLGFDAAVAELAAALTQVTVDPPYYRQAVNFELAAGVIDFAPIRRRPS